MCGAEGLKMSGGGYGEAVRRGRNGLWMDFYLFDIYINIVGGVIFFWLFGEKVVILQTISKVVERVSGCFENRECGVEQW